MRPDACPPWVPLAIASAATVVMALVVVRPTLRAADAFDEQSEACERRASDAPVVMASIAAMESRRDSVGELHGVRGPVDSEGQRRSLLRYALACGLRREIAPAAAADGVVRLRGTIDSASAVRLLEAVDRCGEREATRVEYETDGSGQVTVEIDLRPAPGSNDDEPDEGGLR